MIAGTVLIVRDTLIHSHKHAHTHLITHTHDGSTHTHVIVHSHDHAHVINEGKHGHTHSVEELEIALGHRGVLTQFFLKCEANVRKNIILRRYAAIKLNKWTNSPKNIKRR